MTDFTTRARETAEREAEREYPALQPDSQELTYPRSTLREFRRSSYRFGFTTAVSRLPSEEEIAEILNSEGWTFQGYHEPGCLTDNDCADCWEACAPMARAARELIEKKMLG